MDITPVSHGNSCQTFFVQSETGDYILRGFSSQRQAEQEAAISQCLAKTGVASELILSLTGNYFISFQSMFYNLQKQLPGIEPSFNTQQQIISAAKSVATMHNAFSECTYTFSDYDPFSTVHLLHQAMSMPLPEGLFPNDINTQHEQERFIQKMEGELSKSEIVHGDLGNWNMLWDGNRIYIIDFGESKAGDYYFDLAAVTCSILSSCTDQTAFLHRISLFSTTYEEYFRPIDFGKLHVCVYLWLLCGALASAAIPNQELRVRSIHRFAREIMRYKCYMHLS